MGVVDGRGWRVGAAAVGDRTAAVGLWDAHCHVGPTARPGGTADVDAGSSERSAGDAHVDAPPSVGPAGTGERTVDPTAVAAAATRALSAAGGPHELHGVPVQLAGSLVAGCSPGANTAVAALVGAPAGPRLGRAVGIHPWWAGAPVDAVHDWLAGGGVLGEVGLHWHRGMDLDEQAVQVRALAEQWEWARRARGAVVLHGVGARGPLLDLIRERPQRAVLWHAYVGPPQFAQRLRRSGVIVGVGWREITRAPRTAEVVAALGPGAVVAESDSRLDTTPVAARLADLLRVSQWLADQWRLDLPTVVDQQARALAPFLDTPA